MIHRDHDAAVYGVSAHPSEDCLAIGSYSGLLKIWNYVTKTVVASRKFDRQLMIRCCQYDPRGQYIGESDPRGGSYLDPNLICSNTKQQYYRQSVTYYMHFILKPVFSHSYSGWFYKRRAEDLRRRVAAGSTRACVPLLTWRHHTHRLLTQQQVPGCRCKYLSCTVAYMFFK